MLKHILSAVQKHVPLASGVAGVKVQLPLPSAVVSPIGLPLPSVRITLAPASAVPLMVVPLLGSITGAGGATASTVVAACGPVLPVGSVAVATITPAQQPTAPGARWPAPAGKPHAVPETGLRPGADRHPRCALRFTRNGRARIGSGCFPPAAQHAHCPRVQPRHHANARWTAPLRALSSTTYCSRRPMAGYAWRT